MPALLPSLLKVADGDDGRPGSFSQTVQRFEQLTHPLSSFRFLAAR